MPEVQPFATPPEMMLEEQEIDDLLADEHENHAHENHHCSTECDHHHADAHIDHPGDPHEAHESEHGHSEHEHIHHAGCGHVGYENAHEYIDTPHVHTEHCGHIHHEHAKAHIDNGGSHVTHNHIDEHVHHTGCGHVGHEQAYIHVDHGEAHRQEHLADEVKTHETIAHQHERQVDVRPSSEAQEQLHDIESPQTYFDSLATPAYTEEETLRQTQKSELELVAEPQPAEFATEKPQPQTVTEIGELFTFHPQHEETDSDFLPEVEPEPANTLEGSSPVQIFLSDEAVTSDTSTSPMEDTQAPGDEFDTFKPEDRILPEVVDTAAEFTVAEQLPETEADTRLPNITTVILEAEEADGPATTSEAILSDTATVTSVQESAIIVKEIAEASNNPSEEVTREAIHILIEENKGIIENMGPEKIDEIREICSAMLELKTVEGEQLSDVMRAQLLYLLHLLKYENPHLALSGYIQQYGMSFIKDFLGQLSKLLAQGGSFESLQATLTSSSFSTKVRSITKLGQLVILLVVRSLDNAQIPLSSAI